MGRDPNMIFSTRLDATFGLVELMETAARRIGEVQTPVFYAYGARDYIIPRHAAEVAAARLPPGARTAFYPHGWHLLDRDLAADVVLGDVLAFIRDPKAPLPSGAPPIPPPGRQRDPEGEDGGEPARRAAEG
jgi:alpha-beta hydrolase superfamily lysophospholipase